MPTTRHIITLLSAMVVAGAACKAGGEAKDQATESGIVAEDRIYAGGVRPPANALSAPRPANVSPDAGGSLFSAMNCDGCHGGGAVGWVGPSLVDGRWRYGGADEEIFTSIFYGRPKGMPAYGGVLGSDGAWMLVSYIKAQTVPPVVPTTSWLPGGNATATPTVAKPEGAAAPAAAAEPAAEASVPPGQLGAKYGCTACHAVDRQVIGPSLKDIAGKYRGKDVEAALVEKVKNGGSGVWGQLPMPPNPQVPDRDLQAMLKWILSLK